MDEQKSEKRKLDLSWGNAEFLKNYWSALNTLPEARNLIGSFGLQDGLVYEKEGGRSYLKDIILATHEAVGNADTRGKHVVVGSGATQVLMSALCSLNDAYSLFGVYAKKPHYMRFHSIINLSGLTKISDEAHIPLYKPVVEIVTRPNNPDNFNYPTSRAPIKVHDLCYNWPQYTMPAKYDEEIMIFGLAKATGHAASRIGWALVRDKAIAEMMEYWIELASNGVSIEAQDRAAAILTSQLNIMGSSGFNDKTETVFQYGREVLAKRWRRLLSIKTETFKVINRYGMFAMIEYGKKSIEIDSKKDFENATGIIGVSGDLMGAPDNQIRINMGCSNDNFEDFIEIMSSI